MKRFLLVITAALILNACGEGPVPSVVPEFYNDLAYVEKVEIEILESFPVQIVAVAKGDLNDVCTELVESIFHYEANTFSVTLATTKPDNAICAQVVTPFEQRIPLDVLGLRAGKYTVLINGTKAEFELQVDNLLPKEPEESK